MSNTRKCREGHCGKFTRPRAQWIGRRRQKAATKGAPKFGADMNRQVSMFAANASKILGRQYGVPRFNRKTGD